MQVCSSLLHEAITVRQAGRGLASLLLHQLAGGEVERLLAGLNAQQQMPLLHAKQKQLCSPHQLLFLNCRLTQMDPVSNSQPDRNPTVFNTSVSLSFII